MSVDPSDDCTVWSTHQYVESDAPTSAGRGRWATRIFAFSPAGCPSKSPSLSVPGISFTGSFPSDSNGDVSRHHFVQATNVPDGTALAVFDKAGNRLAGPVRLSDLVPAEGPCRSGRGDPIVLYDRFAERWLIQEGSKSGQALCLYVSESDDPVEGPWSRYELPTAEFPDFPKIAVFPDGSEAGGAYVITTNESSPAIYVLSRESILSAHSPRYERLTAPRLRGFDFQSLTPVRIEGLALPPAPDRALLVRHRDDEMHDDNPDPTHDELEIWEVRIDVEHGSVLAGPFSIPVADFDSSLCPDSPGECFAQPKTATRLDPVEQVVMWSPVYRRFATHESLAGNFTVDADGRERGGIRWFELRRSLEGDWKLDQEGTWLSDGKNRWLGASTIDGEGNITLAYTVSAGDPDRPDPFEPNNTFAEATDVACGFQGNATDIAEGGDVDFFRLSVSSSRTVSINIDAQTDGSHLDAALGLFDSTGRLLRTINSAPAPDEPLSNDPFAKLALAAAGPLTFAVGSAGDATFAGVPGLSAGSYKLSIRCTEEPFDPNEPNDDFESATPLECPSTTRGTSIDPTFDVDFYRIRATAQTGIALTAAPPANVDDRLDVRFFAFDSGRALLGASQPASANPYLEVLVPSDGTVYVAVRADDRLARGKYALSCAATLPVTE